MAKRTAPLLLGVVIPALLMAPASLPASAQMLAQAEDPLLVPPPGETPDAAAPAERDAPDRDADTPEAGDPEPPAAEVEAPAPAEPPPPEAAPAEEIAPTPDVPADAPPADGLEGAVPADDSGAEPPPAEAPVPEAQRPAEEQVPEAERPAEEPAGGTTPAEGLQDADEPAVRPRAGDEAPAEDLRESTPDEAEAAPEVEAAPDDRRAPAASAEPAAEEAPPRGERRRDRERPPARSAEETDSGRPAAEGTDRQSGERRSREEVREELRRRREAERSGADEPARDENATEADEPAAEVPGTDPQQAREAEDAPARTPDAETEAEAGSAEAPAERAGETTAAPRNRPAAAEAGGTAPEADAEEADGARPIESLNRRERQLLREERLRDRERDLAEREERLRALEDRDRGGDRLGDLRRARQERRDQAGNLIIVEPGGRRIVERDGRRIIRYNELDRLRYGSRDVREERLDGGFTRTVIERPGGVRVVTVLDPEGRVVRRVRQLPDGSDVVLFDNSSLYGRPDDRRRPDAYAYLVEDVPPPRIDVPRDIYIVEAERAAPEVIYETFAAPPVVPPPQRYSLDQVVNTPALLDRVRRVDLDTVTFDTGSWTVAENEVGALETIADAILDVLDRNPNEVFLVEGHTDAVGSELDNLTLSDRRAEEVATLLTEFYDVPAENLTTKGYGESQLKVPTEGAERQNRRVTMRRITDLLDRTASTR